MITQAFDLNLIPDSAPVVVHCDQYDKGTGRLVISLYEGSMAYSPDGSAVIQGMKPDGKGFDYECTMSGNVVTANLTEQMTAVAGRVRTQIVVTESTGRTGTFVFFLDVQASALPADSDMSESEYQLIEEAIEEAQQAVIDARQAVDDAEDRAEDAEAWAVGQRGGVDVPSTDDTYHNNSKYWAEQASQYAQGGLHYKGSCLFANIPVSGMLDGDMWNIEDDFVTDNRFREGAGKNVAAGSNIAWVSSDSKWDVLAMVKIGSLNDLADVNITNPQAGQGLVFDSNGDVVNGDVSVSDMTLANKGIGKPDGITTDVSAGTFSAKGVGIVADVNNSGTVHGADWLYYTGTTTVITPNASQMYRVTISGTASLWYWNGSAYVQLASSGGGGGGASLVDVTLAQYNTLTPAEKADPDTWYWINDMDGMSGTAIVVGTFAGLTDTSFSNLQNGQIPVYNSTTQKWENQNITIPSGDFVGLYGDTKVSAGSLNNITTIGNYYNDGTVSVSDFPSNATLTATSKFRLIVEKTGDSASTNLRQTYILVNSVEFVFVRQRVNNSWSSWQRMLTSHSNLNDLSGVTISSPAFNDTILYNNGQFRNMPNTLPNLSDVSYNASSNPYQFGFLFWNKTNWDFCHIQSGFWWAQFSEAYSLPANSWTLIHEIVTIPNFPSNAYTLIPYPTPEAANGAYPTDHVVCVLQTMTNYSTTEYRIIVHMYNETNSPITVDNMRINFLAIGTKL